MTDGRSAAAIRDEREQEFERFAREEGERLKRVLGAHFGLDIGAEVSADALGYAWEHWERIRTMRNPTGYLYRVAQSAARRHWRWARSVRLPPEVPIEAPLPEPRLEGVLAKLSPAQRVAVLLVYGLDWSYAETADAMGVPITTIRNHLHRGMRRLRRLLGSKDVDQY